MLCSGFNPSFVSFSNLNILAAHYIEAPAPWLQFQEALRHYRNEKDLSHLKSEYLEIIPTWSTEAEKSLVLLPVSCKEGDLR